MYICNDVLVWWGHLTEKETTFWYITTSYCVAKNQKDKDTDLKENYTYNVFFLHLFSKRGDIEVTGQGEYIPCTGDREWRSLETYRSLSKQNCKYWKEFFAIQSIISSKESEIPEKSLHTNDKNLRFHRQRFIKKKHSVMDSTTWAQEHFGNEKDIHQWHLETQPTSYPLRWSDTKWKSVLRSDESTPQIVFRNYGHHVWSS